MVEQSIDFNRIREVAKAGRWSTYQIAERTNPPISDVTVWRILKGGTNPTALALKAVCDVIGLPIEEVFIEDKAA